MQSSMIWNEAYYRACQHAMGKITEHNTRLSLMKKGSVAPPVLDTFSLPGTSSLHASHRLQQLQRLQRLQRLQPLQRLQRLQRPAPPHSAMSSASCVFAFCGFFGCFFCFFFQQNYFPTCQVRVVRFYVNSRCRSFSSSASSPDLNYDDHSRVFAAGPQPRRATPSVRCRTSTTTSHAQCSLPDLNHDHPRPVFAAGPQPRPSTPSVRCRTSTAKRYAR